MTEENYLELKMEIILMSVEDLVDAEDGEGADREVPGVLRGGGACRCRLLC